MYEFRKMTKAEKKETLKNRLGRGYPLHAPPHDKEEQGLHLLTAACFEHKPILASPQRKDFFQRRLLGLLNDIPNSKTYAWVVLPNHYHILIEAPISLVSPVLKRLHSGTATQWNREENLSGRKIWYRYSDPKIRNDRHYYATVNYIHRNPVKHGWVSDASLWTWSSISLWMQEYGQEELVRMWKEYPIKNIGKGWDD